MEQDLTSSYDVVINVRRMETALFAEQDLKRKCIDQISDFGMQT